ncbi:MAG: nucleotidyltransferase family protein [Nitrospirae bacterium]|nr:nucleotidyltransferase family protein [Nitrospirota bacterium]
MKAFLLAAGKGTRLEPLTLQTPKCLIPVCGRPLIEYWFDLFKIYGINEVLINTSHLAGNVRSYVNNNSSGLKIKLAHEENLLGSGGTIKKNWDFVKEEKAFFIFYADNLTNINLERMLLFHNKNKKDFTLAVVRVPNPRECGIVEMDENSTVISFTEKPENPVSDLAFAGIMLSNPRLIDFFPDKDVFDLGYDVLPCIVGKSSGYIMEDYLLDIGTFEKLTQADKDLKNNIFKKLIE